jgi:hypothetical protein
MSVDSQSIKEINDAFRERAIGLGLASFWESIGMESTCVCYIVVHRSDVQVIIPQYSATLGFPGEIGVPLNGNHVSIVQYASEQDNNFRVVSKTIAGLIREALTNDQRLFHENNLDHHTGKKEQSSIWNVDDMLVDNPICYLHNAPEPSIHFIERESVTVDNLYGKLSNHRRIVITGLPGIGKTELVRQVIEKAIEEKKYKGIFWVSVATETTFHAEIYALACSLGVLEDPTMNIDTVRKRLIGELNKQDNWLMVLDNVENVSSIKDFLLEKRGVRHVMITSRYSTADRIINGHVIQLEIMTESESNMLFMKEYYPEDDVEDRVNERFSVITQLVKELGCLPLAIIQAAAYLRETQAEISEYIGIYKKMRKSIWDFKQWKMSIIYLLLRSWRFPSRS